MGQPDVTVLEPEDATQPTSERRFRAEHAGLIVTLTLRSDGTLRVLVPGGMSLTAMDGNDAGTWAELFVA